MNYFFAPSASTVCAVVADRNPLTEDYKANILKYVHLLGAQEFGLQDAAAYLQSWVNGTLPMAQFMELDACPVILQVSSIHFA